MKKHYFLFILLVLLPFWVSSQNVTFSSSRGLYESPFQLTLSTTLAGGTMRYTTDGSAPTPTTGILYAGAIPVATTSIIRAVAYNGITSTPVATHSYLFLADVLKQPATISGWPNHTYALGSGSATAVHDYQMDPAVVNNPAYSTAIKSGLTSIPTMSLVLNKDDFWDLYEGETTHPTSVEIFYPSGLKEQFDCELEPHSHNRLKRSLKLRMKSSITSNLLKEAPFNNAATTSTFKDTKLVLRSGNNRSWARNWNPDRTCYTRDEWYRTSQQVISGTGGRGTFVHLYVNGLYWGLYNPVERTDNGMLSTYFGGDFADWMSLDHDGIRDGDPTRFSYLTTTLVNQDMTVAANYAKLKEYLDVEKFCDYLILTWMMGMTDWPGNNFHGGNRNNPPSPFFYNAWDAEWSFDVTNGSNEGAWVHPEFRNTTTGSATIAKLWHAARTNRSFMQLFADRVYKHCFNNGGLTDAASRARWQLINQYINTAIIAESARWGDALNDGVTRTRDTHWTPEINRVDGLMNGNVNRLINALVAQGYYPTIAAPGFNQEGGSIAAGFQLTMTNPNPSGTIYYTIDGTDPQTAEGGVSASARTYTEPVMLTANLTIKARVQTGSTWSALHEVSFTVSGLISGLYINEFMASNTRKPDEFGEFDDWIEIYNATAQPINIGGLYITDALNNLTQWQIPMTNPALTTVPAKGYLLLWADGQPTQGPLHVNLKLSKGGEAIGLSQLLSSTATLLDSYTFGAQQDDVSTGRFPDGSATFRTFVVPTPGSKNAISFRSNLFINEFVAANQTGGTDEAGEHDAWLEIYNNNNEPVDIGGMYLTNTFSKPSLWKIPTTNAAQTTIPGKGFLRLWADNQPAQGVLHLGFGLSPTGGQLALTDIVGPDAALVDSLSYGIQTTDVSRGRYPDGSKQFKFFTTPSPGATNTLPILPGIYINEFMASNANKPDEFGEFDDWIELYNSGTQPVDIGGLYITDDLTKPSKYQIPSSQPGQTTIPPKGFLLLWADEQAAQGVLHVGIKLSSGGEQIGLFQPDGANVALLDSVSFGVQTTDVSIGRQRDGATPFVSFTASTPNASNNPASVGQQITTFTLINADSDLPIRELVANDVLNLATLPTRNLNIRANTNPSTVGSVKFSLSGSQSQNMTETVAPYALFGDVAGNFNAWVPPVGSYTLTATPYSGSGGSGTAGTALTLNFTVVDQTTTPGQISLVGFSLINADTEQEIKLLTPDEQLNLASLPTRNLNIRANTNPATVGSVKFSLSGSQSQNVTETVAPYALFGDVAGNFNAWVPPVGSYTLTATPYTGAAGSGTAGTALTLNFTVVDQTTTPGQISLVGFSLINADTEQEIKLLTPDEQLNLASLPTRNLNIRANTSPVTVGSVKFSLSGSQSQNVTETVAPYALFGDVAGNFNTWVPLVGSYTLTATPYSGSGGSGTAGTPLTLSFTVVNQTPTGRLAAESQEQDMQVRYYPNPFSESFTVLVRGQSSAKAPLLIYDAYGRVVLQREDTDPEQVIRMSSGFAPGLYLLQIGTGSRAKRYKLIKTR
ncbi:lamin tail domain-containing protein [Spirosoma fluviale]|uniref:Por secretion system C-terminal sorting domain-containing protein n=1 Tax=Spirosoma fluviale TaxID=1597977 RepID=A0A286GSK1_9BACT|nr:lamin tail domain-containing protein [Spirosoma fluviale]SOD98547.1 Por secretion system C-terminal sorting domain-containing protein [Spirosoma fluviale]